jgi:tetratricopeptide (TPR) repeat protein
MLLHWFRSTRVQVLSCYRQGTQALEQGDFDLAICCFAAAVRLDRGFDAGYLGRGLARVKKGDYRLALADFSEALRLRPEDAAGYFYRSFCYSGLGDWAREQRDHEKARALDPNVERACVRDSEIPTGDRWVDAGEPSASTRAAGILPV